MLLAAPMSTTLSNADSVAMEQVQQRELLLLLEAIVSMTILWHWCGASWRHMGQAQESLLGKLEQPQQSQAALVRLPLVALEALVVIGQVAAAQGEAQRRLARALVALQSLAVAAAVVVRAYQS